jgi:FkbM family methyltransferase
MNYLSKIAPFNLKERFVILKYSIGSRLINKIPLGIKHTYLLNLRLLNRGIKLRGKNNYIYFVYPINNKKIQFQLKKNSSDSQVFEQIIELEEYLPIIKIFNEKRIIPRTMIDAGANIGLTCLYFKSYYPNLKITAIEPADETFKRLSDNLRQNDLLTVKLLQKGLWSSQTRLKADNSFRDGQDWSFRLIEASDNERALFETISIDNIIVEEGWTSIDFLKIDIEGGEVEIFKDFSKILWLDLVKVIALEIHDEFNCREFIEVNLKEKFELKHVGELTVGINKKIN